jgi:aspartyl-tRNA(Asn)/glutamyl-tRNA(Gln) amidotransferase subunit C
MTKNIQQLTTKDIDHLAKLANLSVSETEAAVYSRQLTGILDYVQEVQTLPQVNQSPVSSISNIDSFRSDEVKPGLSQQQVTGLAPKTYQGYILVNRVLNNE